MTVAKATGDVRGAGHTLRQIREARKWTQRDVEARSGIPNGMLSTLENGVVARPPLDTLAALAKAYDMTPTDMAVLYGYWEETPATPRDEQVVRLERTLPRLDPLARERLRAMIDLALEIAQRP